MLSGRAGQTHRYDSRMASYGKVVGGQFANATIAINRKGDLALSSPGFKKTPNLTVEEVTAWEEVRSEFHSGAASAVSKVGQAVSRAALPGVAGKAASAAVGSAVDLMGGKPHTVRVTWNDGRQSLIQLPDKLFQHLALLLGQVRIAAEEPPLAPPPPPSVIDQLTKLAGAVRPAPQDVTDQISKLAALRDQGTLTDAEFAAKKAELLGTAPAPEPALAPPPPPPPAAPPAWVPDPHGRHELRYWDGASWTEHVSTLGVQASDPV